MNGALQRDESPLHGFQGDRAPALSPEIPMAASIAISREVGARGGEIARRLAAKLAWPIYDRETLEFASRQSEAMDALFAESSPAVVSWIANRIDALQRQQTLSDDADFEREARLILALSAKGEAIFLGRGAGHILPRETTLHVRVVAPLRDRIAYMAQWLRLSNAEAAEQVNIRSQQRGEFLATCVRPATAEIDLDMVLNSSALGEELCADLIIQALRSKQGVLDDDLMDSPV